MSKIQLNAWIIIIMLALVTVGAKSARSFMVQGQPKTDFALVPKEIDGWIGTDPDEPFDDVTRKMLASSSLLSRVYEHADYSPVSLAIVYGMDLGDLHQSEVCLEGQGLRGVKKAFVPIKGGNQDFKAVSLITESDYGKQAFVYWFFSDGVAGTSLENYKMKVFMSRLHSREMKPSALIRISTVVTDSDEESIARLVEFSNIIAPHLEKEFTIGKGTK